MESHYLTSVRNSIEAHKFYPARARRRHEQGTVMLRLVLRRDGSVGEVSLAASSGAGVLDDAALEAVRRVGQFPPFPRESTRRDWVLTVPIRYGLM
jgi:protein TonB